MPTIKIHNAQTGEVIEREMTGDEIKQQQKDLAELTEIKKIKEQKAQQRIALLEKLGLTDEEAAVLLG